MNSNAMGKEENIHTQICKHTSSHVDTETCVRTQAVGRLLRPPGRTKRHELPHEGDGINKWNYVDARAMTYAEKGIT